MSSRPDGSTGTLRSARDRFDPPVLRTRYTTATRQDRARFLADLRARSGWDAARVDSVLWHGGLHLDGRPHGDEDLPPAIGAGSRVDAHAFAWEPEPVATRARVVASGSRTTAGRRRVDWLVVEKPAWTTTQRSRASRRLSLEAALRTQTGNAALVAVHRLDRETSGVVLFAATRHAAARLGAAFADGAVRKRYLAVVSPPPARQRWEVEGWLGRVLDPRRYRFALRADPAPGFRWSHSRFETCATDASYGLVACAPATGRSHQLRLHLAAGGTPIAGDPVYGGAPAERAMLHAAALAFPWDGETLTVRAAPPPDFASLAPPHGASR